MKKTTLVSVIICCTILLNPCFGAKVEKDRAMKVGNGLLKTHPAPMGLSIGSEVRSITPYYSGQTLLYYVAFTDSGFIVLSPDDEIEPVIAMVSGSNFDPSEENCLGALLLSDMQGRLAYIKHKKDAKNKQKWNKLDSDQSDVPLDSGNSTISDIRVNPLTQSKWSQSTDECGNNCYNYYTPANCVSGCVATAFAQLLRFYQYPASTTPVTKSLLVNGVSQNVTSIGGPYDYSLMTLDPSCSTTESQRQAIGMLCFDTGVAVDMEYGTSSAAYTGYIVRELKAHFGYSNAIYGRNTGDGTVNIPAAILYNMVNTNLDSGNPVVIAIRGSSGGHAVIADGYGFDGGTHYHHLNMGWAGSYDLWYNLPTVENSYSFNSVTGCAYNVYISGSGETISGRVTNMAGTSVDSATITLSSTGLSPQTATSNSKGIYSFSNVTGGRYYNITCSKVGMGFNSKSNVFVGVSNTDTTTVGNTWGLDFLDTFAHPPVVQDVNVTNTAGQEIAITLQGSDDGLPGPITFVINSLPSHGTLKNDANELITAEMIPYILANSLAVVKYDSCSYYSGTDEFTYYATDGGTPPSGGDSNVAAVRVNISQPTSVRATFLTEDFTNGFVNGWTVVNGGTGTPSQTWTTDNPGGRSYSAGWTGKFAIVDSDKAESQDMDEQLLSPIMDCSAQTNVNLEFSHWFYRYTDEIADVDISIDGETWINIARYTGTSAKGIVTLNISSYADRQSSVQLRWRYYNANYDWYWGIDTIKVSGMAGSVPMKGDFGLDCAVGYEDLSTLVDAWLTEEGQTGYNPDCDIYTDQIINLLDMAEFGQNWLKTAQ